MDDGDITKSQTPIFHNSTAILLSYDWPPPAQLGEFGQTLTAASAGSRQAANQISEALERKGKRQHTKNVYLIGQTGQGKSTLANVFTGTDNFTVSYAGTGTYGISGCLFQRLGALDFDKQIMVWDTPGMNDQEGLDQMFENKLYGHLTREQTVSTILVVSKDGSRIPGTLKEMLRVYQKAFGESLLSCIAILIGIRLEDTDREEIKAKRRLWVRKISREIGHDLPRERIYFYNARSSGMQSELERLKKMIIESRVYIAKNGNAIYQGILDLRNERNQLVKEETKYQLRMASRKVIGSLEEYVNLQPRIKLKYHARQNYVEVKLLQSMSSIVRAVLTPPNGTMHNSFISAMANTVLVPKQAMKADDDTESSNCKRALRFSYCGGKAKRVLEKSCGLNVKDKEKMAYIMRQAEKKKLVLTKMESETIIQKRRRIQIANYMFVDVDNSVEREVYTRIESIIKGLVGNRHVAEPLIEELSHLRQSRDSIASSSASTTENLPKTFSPR